MPNATDLYRLPTWSSGGDLHVVIETPQGSSAKLAWDPDLGAFTMTRALPLGVTYPHDWGFVPGTRAEDGDPLDALVLHDTGTHPGVVLACRPIGLIELVEDDDDGQRQHNHRLIAVPTRNERWADTTTLDDLPRRTRDEIERFFLNTTFFTAKNAEILGWRSAEDTARHVRECQAALGKAQG